MNETLFNLGALSVNTGQFNHNDYNSASVKIATAGRWRIPAFLGKMFSWFKRPKQTSDIKDLLDDFTRGLNADQLRAFAALQAASNTARPSFLRDLATQTASLGLLSSFPMLFSMLPWSGAGTPVTQDSESVRTDMDAVLQQALPHIYNSLMASFTNSNNNLYPLLMSVINSPRQPQQSNVGDHLVGLEALPPSVLANLVGGNGVFNELLL